MELLLKKYQASLAILTETETNQSYAKTTNLEGFRAFCPPMCVSGPSAGKEVGVIMMVSNNLASSSIPRPDINGNDSVQTVWVELVNHNLLVGGVYRRNRPNQPDLEKEELQQLTKQVLKAVHTGKAVLLLGDLNLDHSNPDHKKKNEAIDLLSVIKAANMKHLKTGITWKSDGRHKVCQCPLPPSSGGGTYTFLSDSSAFAACGCPKIQRVATIDNAYISQSEDAKAEVLDDALSDHFPLLIRLKIDNAGKRSKLKTIFRRDFDRMLTSDFEAVLDEHDWSLLYSMTDANEVLSQIVGNVVDSLDKVAPLKAITFRPDKPKLSLRRDTLEAMASRDAARKSGSRTKFRTLRNKVNRLLKRDKISGVLNRLKKNPGHKTAWQEANKILGRGRGSQLPNCTNNSDPNDTANHQNKFFVKKVADLVASLPSSSQNV